ncbi:uncharacterized protein [Miscanthus floridulus]|uniref:uncharacterized protein n=1 Tax=Miscanthus floridulus TaxID=154761 RepID=UPI0034592951
MPSVPDPGTRHTPSYTPVVSTLGPHPHPRAHNTQPHAANPRPTAPRHRRGIAAPPPAPPAPALPAPSAACPRRPAPPPVPPVPSASHPQRCQPSVPRPATGASRPRRPACEAISRGDDWTTAAAALRQVFFGPFASDEYAHPFSSLPATRNCASKP